MSDPRPAADYPPRVQRWRFAEASVPRRWFWVAAIGGPVAIVTLVAAIVTMVVVEVRDAPGLIDDPRAVQVVGRECALMTSTVDGLPLQGPARERAARVRAQNTAVTQMLEGIRDLDDAVLRDDAPLEQWLGDWDRLLEAREDLAVAVARGDDPALDVPRVDGTEIVERMDGAGLLAGCEVPDALITPVFGDSREV